MPYHPFLFPVLKTDFYLIAHTLPLRPLDLFIFVFLSVNASGQPQKNDINLRTNILSWLEPNAGGPVLGFEYFITGKFSIGADAGFIFYNPIKINEINLGNPNGFKLKPEIRYYLYKKNKTDPTRLFFALEGLLQKQVYKFHVFLYQN